MSCLKLTGEREHDCFVVGEESKSSCAALFAAALGPNESAHHLACDALLQISAELSVLEDALCKGEGSDLNPEILGRVIRGLSERARVAAEVANRIQLEAAR